MTKWEILLAAVGLVFIIEGLFCLALPEHVRKMMLALQGLDNSKYRQIGVVAFALGIVILWLSGWFSGD